MPDPRGFIRPVTLPRAEEAPTTVATNDAATIFMAPVGREQSMCSRIDIDTGKARDLKMDDVEANYEKIV
jgi:hypothetical protein